MAGNGPSSKHRPPKERACTTAWTGSCPPFPVKSKADCGVRAAPLNDWLEQRGWNNGPGFEQDQASTLLKSLTTYLCSARLETHMCSISFALRILHAFYANYVGNVWCDSIHRAFGLGAAAYEEGGGCMQPLETVMMKSHICTQK